DTSKVDANVGTKVGDQMTNQFQLVKGYIELEKIGSGENIICGKLELGTSGKLKILDEATTAIDPENLALMFVRTPGLTVEQVLGNNFKEQFTLIENGLYELKKDSGLFADDSLINNKVNIYAKDGIGFGLMNEKYARSVNTVDGEVTGEIVPKKPLNIIVKTPEGNKTPEGKDRIWELYGDAEGGDNDISTNKVTFINETKDGATTLGSISVSATSGSVVAANIKFDDDVLAADNVTDLKKKSLLTMDFQNEPTIEVAVNKLDGNNNPTGETEIVGSAHVYAHAENGNAVALQLADGVNLRFTGDTENLYNLAEKSEDQKRVGIFAYSESTNQDHAAVGIELEGKAEGETPSTPNFEEGTGFDQTIAFAVPTKIYAKSDGVRDDSECAYSTAVAIGKGNTFGSVLLNESIKYDIGNNNEFISSSSRESASAVIGAASRNCNSIVSGNNVFNIGTNNLFTSSSGYSSVVIGAASVSNASVTGDKHEYTVIGADNTFSSSSDVAGVIGAAGLFFNASVDVKEAIFKIEGDRNTFTSFSDSESSVVIGAASVSNASVTGDKHEYTVIGADNTFSSFAKNYAAGVIGATSKRGGGSSVDVKEAIFKIEGDRNAFTSSSGGSSVVIGAVSSEGGNASVTGDKHEYTVIGADNTFSSSGYSSVMIGAVGLFNASVDVKEAIFKIEGDRNTFTSSSSGYYSVVIGAVSDDDYASVAGDKHEYTVIGADNTFSSSAENYAAAVIGAAGYGASVD
ncbi:MAG: hypothetical protein K2L13_03155, partial [Opitutales bacterium]|nr:hypothetical protein [Opitutales bacterium]